MFFCKFFRIQRELSQKALSKLTGIPNNAICNIERGRTNPNDRELKALARTLGCKPERLMDHVSATPLGDGAEFRDSQNAR